MDITKYLKQSKGGHKISRAFEALSEGGAKELVQKVNRDLGVVMPRGTPTGRTCLIPFTNLEITPAGAVYLCCSGWVKFRLGVLSRGNTLLDMWNGRIARSFRDAMISTELNRVCKCDVCPEILSNRLPRFQNGELEIAGDFDDDLDIQWDGDAVRALKAGITKVDYMPKSIGLALDARCNLRCPSCRPDMITTLPKHEEMILELVAENLELVAPTLRKLHLLGSGEVFYSPFGLQILRSLNRQRYPLLNVQLITNGLLCTEKNWKSLGPGMDLVKMIGVSIDAATKETYEEVRLGGSWRVLQRNLGFIRDLKRSGSLKRTGINFVISAKNFREIPAFIRMGQEFEIDHCMFLLIQRWPDATTADKYKDLAIHHSSHPLHAEYLKVLEDPICQSPGVRLPVLEQTS